MILQDVLDGEGEVIALAPGEVTIDRMRRFPFRRTE